MQVETPQHFFRAGQHALVLIAARLWRCDRDELDLGELVLPDHAARVAPGCARLGTEAWRERREAHRQLLLVDNGLADEIGEGDLGRRDETEPPASQIFKARIVACGRK